MPQIWIKKEKYAKDLPRLLALASTNRMPQDVYAKIMQQRFEVVPNTVDERGGFFVVFTSKPRKQWFRR